MSRICSRHTLYVHACVNHTNKQYLTEVVKDIRRASNTAWRSLFENLGYRIERRHSRGYLLRYNNLPIAVIHPVSDPSYFSRLTEKGELPEGLVLADCEQDGAHWGILISKERYRLFQQEPKVGAATGQYIEIDTGELKTGRLALHWTSCTGIATEGWETNHMVQGIQRLWRRTAQGIGRATHHSGLASPSSRARKAS